MLHRIFDHPDVSGAAVIAVKTAIVYLFLVAGLRLLGKRELGQMSLYDVVMIIILGNAVQNAMVGSDTTLVGGIVGAVVLLGLNRGLNTLIVKSPPVGRFMVGQPVMIVHDGVPLADRMRHEGVTTDQLMAALREHGLEDLSQVHICVLEVDGTISVIPRDAAVLRTKRHYRGLRLP